LSSFSSQTGASLPTLSNDTLTTATSATAYGTGNGPFTTGTSGPLSSSTSFGPYGNSTSSTSYSSSTSTSTSTTPTIPVYALPTHHEGHHKQHGEHYYDGEQEDEVDLFFVDA
jgi:hypothetical protein